MSVLVFIDQADGHIKKASYEVLSYGAVLARQIGTTAEGIVLGSITEDLSALGRFGVKKIYQVSNEILNHFDAQVFTMLSEKRWVRRIPALSYSRIM